ncbi:MAG: hypothetical protein AAFX39_04240 [Pseudomonadota bacterium]
MSNAVSDPMRFQRGDFGDLRIRARRYLECVLWIVRSVFTFDRRRFLVVIYLSVIGRAVQAAALALLFYIAHNIESGTEIGLGDMSISFGDFETILIGLVAVAAILLLGAVLIFVGRRVLVGVCTDFGDFCSREALVRGATAQITSQSVSGTGLHRSVRRNSLAAFIFTRATSAVLTALSPITVLLFSVVALIYLAPMVALGLLVFVLPTASFIYLINLRAVQNQHRLMRSSSLRKRRIRSIAAVLTADNRPASRLRPSIDAAFDRPDIADAMSAFRNRLLAATRAEYVANFLIAGAATILVAFLVADALAGDIRWIVLISTVVVLRFVLMAIRSVVISVTQYARFHPAVRNLFELLTARSAGRVALPQTLESKTNWSLPDIPSAPFTTLKRGQPIAMIAPDVLGRYTLFAFTRNLASGIKGSKRPTYGQLFAASAFATVMTRIDSPLKLSESVIEGEAANVQMERLSKLAAILSDLPPVEDTLSPETFSALSEGARASISLAVAALQDADVVFLDAKLIETLQRDQRDALWTAFADSFILIAYQADAEKVCRNNEAVCALVEGTGPIYWADAQSVRKSWKGLRDVLWQVSPEDEDDVDDEDMM